MADAKFTFQEKGKMYHPAWIAPEVWYSSLKPPLTTFLQAMSKSPADINVRAADMWSYAVLLWELATRSPNPFP